MLSIIRCTLLLGTLLLTAQSNAATQGAEIRFNSACDFKELKIRIKEEQEVNSGYVTLETQLQPEVVTRLAQLSRQHMNQNLTTYINGVKVSTATIRSELNVDGLQITVDKTTAKKIFPSLLATQCKPSR
jgi:preprotein translocase subunit SecD